MPAVSKKQREATAIAEHNPGKLYKKNKGILKMSKAQLHEYASTKGLKGKQGRKKGSKNKKSNWQKAFEGSK
jgi:hypothetical protein